LFDVFNNINTADVHLKDVKNNSEYDAS
jgi:hypothetical protein